MGEDTFVPRPAGRSTRHRILIIEDHVPLAEATAEFLQSQGMKVRIAATGEAGLEIAATFRPEIVLCDLRLPDMPGLDVVQALRAMPGMNRVLFVIHTALSERELGVFERQANVPEVMFMSKPITAEKLDALVAELKVLQSSAPLAPVRAKPEKAS